MSKQKQFIQDMFDILSPYIDQQTGKDDFIYGNCVEWQDLDDVDDSIILTLLDYFGADPFDTREEAIQFFQRQ